MNRVPAVVSALVLLLMPLAAFRARADDRANPHRYNVTWNKPAKDGRDSMPLGNGDLGVNMWVEESGDVVLTVGKTDTWGDNGRLLKIGRVRFSAGTPRQLDNFQQTLHLSDATVRATWRTGLQRTNLEVWVDAHHPTIHVSLATTTRSAPTASIDLWRTARFELPGVEVSDIHYDRLRDPPLVRYPTFVEPDQVLEDLPDDQVGWIHHNTKSVGPDLTARLQGLADMERDDPLLNRVFGAVIRVPDGRRRDGSTLQSPSGSRHRFSIHVLTQHPSDPDRWKVAIARVMKRTNSMDLAERRQRHEQWWHQFWQRSWIHVSSRDAGDEPADGKDDAFVVSRGYALQRYLFACAGRGRYPIKFNGSLFNVAWPDKPGDADYRRWGPGYWWQNTRFPYIPMCTAGDFDLMKPLFRMYQDDVLPVAIARTKRYFGHEGAFFPECVYFWGDVFPDTYGWTPYEQRGEDKLQEAGWHKWLWVPGPELLHLMLEYYEYTRDQQFLDKRLLPAAWQILTFFDEHYELDDNGHYHMYPGQAVETWWDCTNPMPELAGLHDLSERLLRIAESRVTADARRFWKSMQQKLPPLPTRKVDGKRMLAPAARFEKKISIELPELYAVYPFRRFGVGRPDIELAIEALNQRESRGHDGWRQDDIFMACLGLAEDARKGLVQRARAHDPSCRFPAFWGPNFDWTPDQTHGGALMKTLQLMVLQADGERLFVLPAWPESWDVDFKLHAPRQTTVQGVYRDGQFGGLLVVPQSRRSNVEMIAP